MSTSQEYENKLIGIFTTTGLQLTQKQMVELSKKAVKSVENGKGLSSNDIRKLKEYW